jgi:hypothetical protein
MALNPFHAFRKHQKTLLAVLTIFTMFIFILTGFSGGIGSRGGSGSGGEKAKPVAKVYGEELYLYDFQKLREQRELANLYMILALQGGHEVIIGRAERELIPMLKDERDTPLREMVKQVVDAWNKAFSTKKGSGDPFSLAMYYRMISDDSPRSPRWLLARSTFLLGDDKKGQRELLDLLTKMMAQDARLVPLYLQIRDPVYFQQFLQYLSYIDPNAALRAQLTLQSDPLYFGAGSLENVRDLVDFKIWLHEADRLGIKISPESLQKMIAQEGFDQVTEKGMKEAISTTLGSARYRNRKPTPDLLEQSLNDEYRVRLARLSLLGYEALPPEISVVGAPGMPPRIVRREAVPLAVSPYEAYKYFSDNRSEKTVVLLPVNADQLIASEVPAPPDAELKKLYEQYKNREADPGSPEPGFRQPPRRTVEWVRAKPSDAFYKEQAKKDQDRQREAVLAAMQVAAGSLSATGQAPAAPVVSVLPRKFDLVLESFYSPDRDRPSITSLTFEERDRYRTPSWLDNYNSKLHASSLNRPENVAALVGQAVGVGGTKGTILSAPAAFQGAGWASEAKQRARRWSELILAGAAPGPFGLLTAPGIAWTMEPKRDYLPLKAVKAEVEETLRERLARSAIDENFKTFQEELNRLAGSSGEGLLQRERTGDPKLVAATIGLAVGGNVTGNPLAAPFAYSGVVTEQEMRARGREAASLVLGGQLPLLAPLQVYERQTLPQQRARLYIADAIKRYGFESGRSDRPSDRFEILKDDGLKVLRDAYLKGHDFVAANRPKDFYRLFEVRTRFYQPRTVEENSLDSPLYWITSEEAAYTPTFEEARPRVLERWQLSRAGVEAKKKAEEIAAQVKKEAGGNGKEAARILRQKAADLNTNLVTLDKVSRLTTSPTPAFMAASAMGGSDYKRYTVPDDKVEYPSARFLDEVLKLGTEGEVKVLHNRPETTYYVAVLENKPTTVNADDFYVEYSLQNKGRALIDQYDQDEHVRLKFQEGVLAQLQKTAGLYIDPDVEKDFNRRRDE